MTRIGDHLVRRGLIAPDALAAALRRQQDEGGQLGQHLLDGGLVTRQQLYDGLAEQWHLARRDLDVEPPDPDLVARVDLDRDLALGWVPCEISADGHVVVATSVRPGPDLVAEVREQFPTVPVRFVACTRRDLDHLAIRLRRRPLPPGGPSSPPATAWCRSMAVRDLLGGAVAVLLLTVVVVAPPTMLAGVLVVSGVVFLAAVVVQVSAAFRTAVLAGGPAQDGVGTRPGAGSDSAVLPTYTVLVAVGAGDDLERALGLLTALDYPSVRTDAVLLVTDVATLADVRRAAPPSWVRVAACPPGIAADPVAVYDEGLALARGRYVVAFAPDESPAPDQLRRAVDAFEADLAENLGSRPDRQPLAGLRVTRRVRDRSWSVATGLDELDRTLLLDRAYPWIGAAADLRHELTSVHFNTHVLRRNGGWRFAVVGDPPARMGRLDSTTRGPRPRLGSLVGQRAGAVDRAVRLAVARAGRIALGAPGSPRLREVLLGFVLPALLLSYPAGLLASVALVVRRAEAAPVVLRFGVAGGVVLALGLVLAMGAAGMLGVRRQGWGALVAALLLPVLWLVHAVAAWYAALVLLPCRRPDGAVLRAAPRRRPG